MRMPVLDRGLPTSVAVHKSGGRDLWSDPMPVPPADPDAALLDCLTEVLDPEIPISLVELGLIYGARLEGGVAHVDLTFTATACPCMEFIREDVADRLLQEAWIDDVEIHEVWDPPWSTDRITAEGRAKLKRLGVGAV
ncbi:MAG TPA: metal-sulfur cluster assembly factor [Longimicrobiales bacterium]|nr:metal-sulfur cluster assembly factor [Longimicrobiales bacterium]